jgi:hypothetical protein
VKCGFEWQALDDQLIAPLRLEPYRARYQDTNRPNRIGGRWCDYSALLVP